MRRFLTPRWIARHLLMIVLVGACLGLGWWQIGRAAGGNALSFGYAIEWPVFALFVIFIWFRELRAAREPTGGGAHPDARQPAGLPLLSSVPAPTRRPVEAEDADPRLRAYNEYLAWLNADPTRRPADYPGPSRPGVSRPGASPAGASQPGAALTED